MVIWNGNYFKTMDIFWYLWRGHPFFLVRWFFGAGEFCSFLILSREWKKTTTLCFTAYFAKMILLMEEIPSKKPPFGCKLPTEILVITGFLNHQQYHHPSLSSTIRGCRCGMSTLAIACKSSMDMRRWLLGNGGGKGWPFCIERDGWKGLVRWNVVEICFWVVRWNVRDLWRLLAKVTTGRHSDILSVGL